MKLWILLNFLIFLTGCIFGHTNICETGCWTDEFWASLNYKHIEISPNWSIGIANKLARAYIALKLGTEEIDRT